MRLTTITASDISGAAIGAQVPEQQIRGAVLDILRQNVLCSIATVTSDGRPHISTAYFCHSEELELYVLSHPRSVHCQNSSANSAAAMTICSSPQQWGRCDVGLQLFGTGLAAEGPDAKKAEESYAQPFSGYTKWKGSPSGAGSEYRFFRFIVLRVRVLDEAHLGDGIIVSATVHRD
jgi:uncharacterized protein YhbP (UPF0306 family)